MIYLTDGMTQLNYLPTSERTTDEIANDCREASRTRCKDGARCCFELFRRAFEQGDERAWDAIVLQYKGMVCKWIHKTASYKYDNEAAYDLTIDVFAKMWRTLSPDAARVTIRFPNTGAILGYLRRCTISVIHDELRRERRNCLTQMELTDYVLRPTLMATSKPVEKKLERRERIASINVWIAENVSDPCERLLLKLTYEYGLPPREIVKQFSEQFPDVRTVKRVKDRILKRARRKLLHSQF